MSNRQQSRGPRPFGGGGGRSMSTERAKDFKGSFRKLLNYLKPYQFRLLLSIVFSIGSTIFAIVGPKVLGEVFTVLGNGIMSKISNTGGIDFTRILQIITTLGCLYLISALFSYIQGTLTAGVAQKVSYQLRKTISEKINRLPLKFFDTQTHGEILSRITNDVDTVSSSLTQSLSQIISSAVTIVGILVMMISISWQMTLLALAIVPLSLLMLLTIIKRSQKYFAKQQEHLGELNGHIEEMYGGHTVIKAFNGEEESIHTFSQYNEKLYTTAWRSQFMSGLMQPITVFVGNLGYVGVCMLGGYYAYRNVISIGDIQSFISYMRSFTQPITQTAQITNVLQSTMAAAERVFEFLDEPEEVAETTTPASTENIQGTVSFENVHFGYNEDKIVINDFSAYIDTGKRVAIVGPTGAGKTTIIKLLMRFYELNSGSIYIDGIDITDFRRNDLRKLFGVVLQDAWLFNGTIMDNIRYGNIEASDEEVMVAADTAYVDHFIRTLDHGYETVIDEESTNISHGQKQLLTIARAFLANPKILILDEATSSVDTRTEILIQKGIAKLLENRTSFIIAHRLSTIRDADIILVMNEGDIVEVGNHQDLLQAGGFYAQLYQSQFENTEEEE